MFNHIYGNDTNMNKIQFGCIGTFNNKNHPLPLLNVSIPFGLSGIHREKLGNILDDYKNIDWFNSISRMRNLRNSYSYNSYNSLSCQVVNYSTIRNYISRKLIIGTKPKTGIINNCKEYKYSICGIIISTGICTPFTIWILRNKNYNSSPSGEFGICIGYLLLNIFCTILFHKYNSGECGSGN